MIHVKDINKITGYIRGGCSPIGMKKAYTTFIEESCLQHDTIIFSAGKIGYQIAMNPKELMKLIHAQCAHKRLKPAIAGFIYAVHIYQELSQSPYYHWYLLHHRQSASKNP